MDSFNHKEEIDLRINARAFRPKLKFCISGKPIYTKREAEIAKNHRWQTDHVELRIYHCPFCNFQHLTSKVKTHDKYRKKFI